MIDSILNFLRQHGWLIQLACVLVGALIFSWLVSFLYARLHPRLEKTTRIWDHTLLSALQTPLVYYIWVFSLTLMVPLFFRVFGFAVPLNDFNLIRELFTVFFLFWFVMRYVSSVESLVLNRPVLAVAKTGTNQYKIGQPGVTYHCYYFGYIRVYASLGSKDNNLVSFWFRGWFGCWFCG